MTKYYFRPATHWHEVSEEAYQCLSKYYEPWWFKREWVELDD